MRQAQVSRCPWGARRSACPGLCLSRIGRGLRVRRSRLGTWLGARRRCLPPYQQHPDAFQQQLTMLRRPVARLLWISRCDGERLPDERSLSSINPVTKPSVSVPGHLSYSPKISSISTWHASMSHLSCNFLFVQSLFLRLPRSALRFLYIWSLLRL